MTVDRGQRRDVVRRVIETSSPFSFQLDTACDYFWCKRVVLT